MERVRDNSFIGSILKGVIISIISTLVGLTIFSLLLVNTNLSENLIQPVVIGITGVSILIGSFIANVKNNKNGLLNGALIGFFYTVIIYIISSFANNMDFSLNIGSIIMIIVGLIGGAVGGIIGVNIH
jgi:putative membrane protein (TIGR04086 family)